MIEFAQTKALTWAEFQAQAELALKEIILFKQLIEKQYGKDSIPPELLEEITEDARRLRIKYAEMSKKMNSNSF